MDTPSTERPTSGRTPLTTRSPGAKRPSFGDYHPDDRVNRPITAKLLGPISPRTLEDWARDGKGPPFQKLGTGRSARVVYRVGDLLEWLDAQTRASTTVDPEAA